MEGLGVALVVLLIAALAKGSKARIKCNFPQVTIRILEVSSVATVERCVRGLDDLGTSPLGLLHDSVDFLLGGDVVCKGKLRTTGRLQRQATVAGQTHARPQGQLQAGFQVEECDGSVLDLRSDDSLRYEAETVSVESYCAFEVVDPKGNERDVWLHDVSAMFLRRLTFDMRGPQKAQPFVGPLDGRVRALVAEAHEIGGQKH